MELRGSVEALRDDEFVEFELVHKGHGLRCGQDLASVRGCSKHLGEDREGERVQTQLRFVEHQQCGRSRLEQQRGEADETQRTVRKSFGRKHRVRTDLLPSQPHASRTVLGQNEVTEERRDRLNGTDNAPVLRRVLFPQTQQEGGEATRVGVQRLCVGNVGGLLHGGVPCGVVKVVHPATTQYRQGVTCDSPFSRGTLLGHFSEMRLPVSLPDNALPGVPRTGLVMELHDLPFKDQLSLGCGNQYGLVGIHQAVFDGFGPQFDPSGRFRPFVQHGLGSPAKSHFHAEVFVGDATQQFHRLNEVALSGTVGAHKHGERAEVKVDGSDRLIPLDGHTLHGSRHSRQSTDSRRFACAQPLGRPAVSRSVPRGAPPLLDAEATRPNPARARGITHYRRARRVTRRSPAVSRRAKGG
ncbi:hypothetical protein GCM10009716_24340 [Streptomyces sodiiphilus]|uniref:Uncharacterized protein n=1 Tax=Streptomyces sodiiphilus TaxID=226217 RepID=A0ABN2P9Z6_9ACTN